VFGQPNEVGVILGFLGIRPFKGYFEGWEKEGNPAL